MPQDRSQTKKRPDLPAKKAAREDLLTQLLKDIEDRTGYTAVREYKFHGSRKWRLDVAWTEPGVALEVEGGVWIGGRHTSGQGFVADMVKYNEANILGWKLYRTTWQDIKSGATLTLMLRALGSSHDT